MRSRQALIALASVGLAVGLAPGCTFGGLAEYAVETCEPSKRQAEDVCDRLNKGDPESCTPFQCDSATLRCVQRPRDDDRDGEPSNKCGGHDCDDTNANRYSSATETCDLIDNDCNGLVDDVAIASAAERPIVQAAIGSSAEPILAPIDEQRRGYLAAFVSGTCIPFVTLEAGAAASSGCAVLKDEGTLAPRQPFPLRTETGYAAAFVATSGCAGGRLAYRVEGATKLDLACDPSHPVALPSVAAMPSTANANSGIVAWFEAPLSQRGEPIGACAKVTRAPLGVLRLTDLRSIPTPQPTRDDALFSQETSVSTRPAAFVPVEAAGGMLVAAPIGDDVGVWLLTPAAFDARALPAPVHVPELANAHAVALAIHAEGTVTRIALAAEIGCRPQMSVKLALGAVDSSGVVHFDQIVDLAGPTDVATAPSVSWVEGRGEWWVTWVDSAPSAHVRRVRADGTLVGEATRVASSLALAAVSSSESVFGFNPRVSGGSFVEIPLGCP